MMSRPISSTPDVSWRPCCPQKRLSMLFADLVDFNTRVKNKEIQPQSVIVAGKNFGCGSSREQAASCLKGPDFIVIARDFARIFLQNSINLGLNTIICPGIEAEEGDELNNLSHACFEQVEWKKLRDRTLAPGATGDH